MERGFVETILNNVTPLPPCGREVDENNDVGESTTQRAFIPYPVVFLQSDDLNQRSIHTVYIPRWYQ